MSQTIDSKISAKHRISLILSLFWNLIGVLSRKFCPTVHKAIGPQDHFAEASAVIIVLGDQNIAPYWYLQDPMISAEHLVLAGYCVRLWNLLDRGACRLGSREHGSCQTSFKDTRRNKYCLHHSNRRCG